MTETKSKLSVKKAAVSETTAKKAAPTTRAKKTSNVISNQERYELIQRTSHFLMKTMLPFLKTFYAYISR
jgi:hypothetical protein